MLRLLMAAVLSSVYLPNVTLAEESSKSAVPMEARVRALIPDLEVYIQSGMQAFDAPGLVIGIVTGDRLVYAKGFGVSSKAAGAPVDSRTVFQIGSATKAFLATTIAICGRSRQAPLGRPRRRSRSEVCAQGPLGDARVPGVRPDGAALGHATPC
jgi:hypothetical protein